MNSRKNKKKKVTWQYGATKSCSVAVTESRQSKPILHFISNRGMRCQQGWSANVLLTCLIDIDQNQFPANTLRNSTKNSREIYVKSRCCVCRV